MEFESQNVYISNAGAVRKSCHYFTSVPSSLQIKNLSKKTGVIMLINTFSVTDVLSLRSPATPCLRHTSVQVKLGHGVYKTQICHNTIMSPHAVLHGLFHGINLANILSGN